MTCKIILTTDPNYSVYVPVLALSIFFLITSSYMRLSSTSIITEF